MKVRTTVLVGAVAFLTSCGTDKPDTASDVSEQAAAAPVLSATLSPTEGSRAAGTIHFETGPDGGVVVKAIVSGLDSGGRHGMHIHEFGDCSAPDGSSAGGHYNPDGSPHGAPENPPDRRHAGDLGNLIEVAEGVAEFETTDRVIQLEGDRSIEDKAVIVHSGEDDFTTQPTGGAGTRLACGVIERE